MNQLFDLLGLLLVLLGLSLDRESNGNQDSDGSNANVDSKVKVLPDLDTVGKSQKQERDRKVVDGRLSQQHTQHVVPRRGLARVSGGEAWAKMRPQQLSGGQCGSRRGEHEVVSRVESVPEGADSESSKGLQGPWLRSWRDDSEVDRVLQPLVGAHVPVVGQGFDALAGLVSPDIDVGGGVPERLARLGVLSVVTESSHDTSTLGHLPDSIVLETGSKGSQLNISEAQDPGEGLPGRVECPKNI